MTCSGNMIVTGKSSTVSSKRLFWPLKQVTSGKELGVLVLSCTIMVSVFAGVAQFMSSNWGQIGGISVWGYIMFATLIVLFPALPTSATGVGFSVSPIAAIGVGIGYFAVRRGSGREVRIGRAGTGYVLGFLGGSFLIFFVNFNGDVVYLAGFLGALAGVAAAVMATTVFVRLRGQEKPNVN